MIINIIAISHVLYKKEYDKKLKCIFYYFHQSWLHIFFFSFYYYSWFVALCQLFKYMMMMILHKSLKKNSQIYRKFFFMFLNLLIRGGYLYPRISVKSPTSASLPSVTEKKKREKKKGQWGQDRHFEEKKKGRKKKKAGKKCFTHTRMWNVYPSTCQERDLTIDLIAHTSVYIYRT